MLVYKVVDFRKYVLLDILLSVKMCVLSNICLEKEGLEQSLTSNCLKLSRGVFAFQWRYNVIYCKFTYDCLFTFMFGSDCSWFYHNLCILRLETLNLM